MPPNEFDIIQQYFQRPAKNASVKRSVGDDCALLSVAHDKQLVVSMDTIVAGRHFPADANPYDIATRALCTSLSDLAAMGAKPLWFTLGLTLPAANKEWLASFSQGLFAIADQYHCDLIGGDTTKGPLTVTIQVHGEVGHEVMCRHHACVGDSVFVTGCLGDGAAALSLLQDSHASLPSSVEQQYLHQRFYAPEPQIAAGITLASMAHAAIDISDGLLADLGHIAAASKVNIEVEIDALPLSQAAKGLNIQKVVDWALTGGDDYKLAFTAPQAYLDDIQTLIDQQLLQATCIGRVTESVPDSGQVYCLRNGEPFHTDYLTKGFQHFAS